MSAQDPQLYLSPGQQDLLMAALNSNQPAASDHSRSSPNDLFESPPDTFDDLNGDDNAYLDFDVDGDGDYDENYDYDGSPEKSVDAGSHGDLHDKRKSIDGNEDDEEGGGKRREGDDKTSKKPGRKPLTSEPTSKRKAQNRAAQRAFRERKEKHLKDLETKVEGLEKASESTSHENGLLRAQVERLQVELKEYRKRLSWVSSNGATRPPQVQNAFTAPTRNGNPFNNDFQFEFPKFGDLPVVPPSVGRNAQNKTTNGPSRSSTLPSHKSNQQVHSAASRAALSGSSPGAQAPRQASTGNSPRSQTYSASPVGQQHKDSIESLSGLFSPSILEASRNSVYGYFPPTTANVGQQSRTSLDNGGTNNPLAVYASSSNTDSPASSSDAHQQSSSIGTSPEPSLSSPGQKQHDLGLNPISENQVSNSFGKDALCEGIQLACGCAEDPIPPIMKMSSNHGSVGSGFTPGFEPNGINWLAQQNGGGFDPMLFGDYRESQDAVVTQDFGSFFNDAFPLPDLGSPQHNFTDVVPAEAAPKNDLLDQVDAVRDGAEEVVPGEDRAKMMTCNKIWDRLQSMEKFRNGEIDVDNLCSELRAKARCSEGGAVVEEKDVDRILNKAK